ncbi:nuclear transport factor 2 family protein [Ruegeria arenilitoris]|uniref:nuclear transport factor 2 family protein n=1 Tax=Ruegeria arenilitoris TaxID=1173585 RepID=UPI00147AEF35|nr:nuclear transport factor 2 family protein [Ruegeria arenilitoris]
MKLLPILAAATTAIASPSFADDTAQINTAITSIAAGADRHDWDRVRGAFADEVTLDYSSLWGGEPATLAADDVIAQWSGFLPGFEVTHHMVTNETIVSIEGDMATAQADFTATHRIGQDFWVLGGQYDYTLIRDTVGWKVSGLTMTALWETGSRDLVTLAAQRASGGN